jgi:hypothetical protein
VDQVHALFRKSPVNGISVVVRDRYVCITHLYDKIQFK